jgi:L-iditol 2-dehydrogenase
MKAALFYGDSEDLRLEEVSIPQPGDGDVLIKVKICGICGSDTRLYFNGNEPRYSRPIILGHEVVGMVFEKGKDVTGFSLGDRVAVAPIYGCGRCDLCLSGYENLCKDVVVFGTNFPGGFAEYMLIPEKGIERGALVKLDERISDKAATMIEPFSCALHGLRKININPGDNIIVFGSGPLGLAFLLLSKRLGAGKVAVIAKTNGKLKRAEDFGADVTFSTESEGWDNQVRNYFGERGVDIAVTAASTLPVLDYSIKLIKRNGKILIFSGLPTGSKLTIDPNYIHYNEITLYGSIDATVDDYMRTALMAPYLDLDRFSSHNYPLEKIKEGFEATKEKDRSRINLDIMKY